MSEPPAQAPASAPAEPPARMWARRIAQALGLLTVFTVAVLAVVYGEEVRDRFEGAGYLAVLVLTALASATLILPAPGAVVVGIFAEALQNAWLVGLVAATGQTIGELSGYYVGWSGRGAASRLRGYARVHRWMQRRGVVTLFLLALIPNPFFDVAGIIAGSTRFGVVRFVAASWPGRAIKNIGFAFAGLAGADLLGKL